MTQIDRPEERIEIRKWAWLMFMRSEKYFKIKKQLQELKEENKFLKDDNELMHNMYNTSFEARLKANNDNFNLEELARLGTSLSIIMSQMLTKCDEDTLVGSAYKNAILTFQRALAEGFGYLRANNINQSDATWNTPLQ